MLKKRQTNPIFQESDIHSSQSLYQHQDIESINSRDQKPKVKRLNKQIDKELPELNQDPIEQPNKPQTRRQSTRRKIQSPAKFDHIHINDNKKTQRSKKQSELYSKSQQSNSLGKASQRQEQKLLYQAIKNSLMETKNTNENLDLIDSMPVFRPTEQEFNNPIDYIESLSKHKVQQYGCIKIIPPKSFCPPCAFDMNSNLKMPTRYQVLQQLSQGIPFNQNLQGHSFKDFQDIARKRESEDDWIDWSNDEQVFQNIESKYWDHVEHQIGDHIKVEYAADLNAKKFGSGFGVKGQRILTEEQKQYQDHPWNFSNFQNQDNSLLQFPGVQDISGINIPWMYIGMKFSTFCWHYEDLMLPSINYNHWGKPKLWYGIPESYRENFERAIKEKCSLLFKKDPNILFDVITMISPAYLQSQGVKLFKTLQRPGEFVLTYPGAYHGGFSTGLNIGEAVNFITKSWIPYGIKCQQIYRQSRERIPVFPIEWILVQNIINLEKTRLDKQTLINIRNSYKQLLKDEINCRKVFENKLKQFYIKQNIQDPDSMVNHHISYLPDRDNVDEDTHQCKFCTDLCYLSMAKCCFHTSQNNHNEAGQNLLETANTSAHQQNGDLPQESKYQKRQRQLSQAQDSEQFCMWHLNYCGCSWANLSIVYRYSTNELQQYLVDINNAIEKMNEPIVVQNKKNASQSRSSNGQFLSISQSKYLNVPQCPSLNSKHEVNSQQKPSTGEIEEIRTSEFKRKAKSPKPQMPQLRMSRSKANQALNYSTRVHYASTDSLVKSLHGRGGLNQIFISDADSSTN